MIGKYNKMYFCIDVSETPYNIWRYDFVEGFDKGVTKRGTVYYEKFVLPEELEEIIDVDFSIKWNDKWCGASYSSKKNIVGITSGDKKFAEKHNFTTVERGVYASAIPIEECQAFRMYIRHLGEDERLYKELTMDEFKLQWRLTQEELTPPR